MVGLNYYLNDLVGLARRFYNHPDDIWKAVPSPKQLEATKHHLPKRKKEFKFHLTKGKRK